MRGTHQPARGHRGRGPRRAQADAGRPAAARRSDGTSAGLDRPQGIEGRIRVRLQALAYWREGRPDVARFCREKGYLTQYVYGWLKGRVPMAANLFRLGADLGVQPVWLLFGENAPDGWLGAEIRRLLRPPDPPRPRSSRSSR